MILLFTVVQGHSYGQQANVDVTFRWVPDRTVVRVLLPGSFNGWSDQSSAQMTFNSTQGQWHHTYSLTQGMSYEYKIRPFTSETENVWLVDPLNDTQSNANDPNSNSVVSVTDPMIFQMARHQNGSGAITAVSAGIFSSKTLTKLTTQVNGPEFDALPYYSNGVFYYSLAAPIWCDLGFKITAEYSDGTTITESLGMDAFPSVAVVDEARPSGIEDGVNYNSTDATKATLSVFVPGKCFMHVIGDFNNWTFGTTPLKRHALHADSVHWWVELTGLTSGEQIGYQYVSEGTGAETDLRFADMFSTLILDATNDPHIPASIYPNIKSYPTGMTTGPVSILQTNQTAYNWTVTDFERPDHEELVIYELLMRDFLAEHDWEALTDTLGYLEKLGINAIELMPIAEFNGNLSWGYNPTFYFAPDKYYGPAEDLKEFIDEAHKRGIAVILDVVYNHVDQPSPLVTLYDAADNPWINTPAPHGVLSFFYDLNHENTYTRYWLDRVNKYWMTEFNVDGFRFDLTKGMTQTVTTDDAGWSNYDQSRINILKRMADSLWAVDDEAYIILEHWTADQEERELGTYRTSEGKPGMMVWGNVTHPFQEALMGYHDSAGKSNFSNVYYGMGGRGWPVPNVVTFMESHDEQWQMYQMRSYGNSSGSYDVKTLPVALNRLKMAGTFAFLIPEPRMIWQFGELGYGYGDMGEQCLKEPASCLADGPGRVDAKPIRWDYNAGTRRLLYETWASLLKIRKENEIFRSRVTEVYMSGMNDAAKRIFLRHAATNMEEVIVGNFGVKAVNNIAALPTTPSIWYDYFSGESVTPSSLPSQLQPGEFHLYTSQKLTPPDQVLIPDNEGNTAGIDIAEEEVTVEEGSSVQVAVKLTSKPSNDVTINITGQISKIAVDTDSSTPNINESTLTFTPTNWGTAKMVTVTGEQDDDIQDETMTVTFTSVSADLN